MLDQQLTVAAAPGGVICTQAPDKPRSGAGGCRCLDAARIWSAGKRRGDLGA